MKQQSHETTQTPLLSGQEIIRAPSFLAAKIIAPVALQTTNTTIYTALDDADFIWQHLWVANTTAGAVTYTIHLVDDGGSAATANAVCYQVSLAANASAVVDAVKGMRCEPGMFWVALCGSNNAINIGGWGYDQTGEPNG